MVARRPYAYPRGNCNVIWDTNKTTGALYRAAKQKADKKRDGSASGWWVVYVTGTRKGKDWLVLFVGLNCWDLSTKPMPTTTISRGGGVHFRM